MNVYPYSIKYICKTIKFDKTCTISLVEIYNKFFIEKETDVFIFITFLYFCTLSSD